jgi:hypothetical protein
MRFATVLPLLCSVRRAVALLDADTLASQYFGNDAAWYRERIPFFESSDKDITDVYYYRWKIFRAISATLDRMASSQQSSWTMSAGRLPLGLP